MQNLLNIISGLDGGFAPDLYDLQTGNSKNFWLNEPNAVKAGTIWQSGYNVRFHPGAVAKIPGWVSAFTPVSGTSSIRGMAQINNTTTNQQQLFYGDLSNLYLWNGGNSTPSKVFGPLSTPLNASGGPGTGVAQTAGQWSMQPWGTWMLATPGENVLGSSNPPLLYNPSVGSFAASMNTPFSWCEVLAKWGPYVLACNTSDGWNWVEWCNADDPTTWTPTATNTAGNYVIRDLDSPIVAVVPLQNNLAIYSQNTMVICSYAGYPYVFSFQVALSGIGAISKNAVVSVGRHNYGLSEIGFWQTDGTTVTWIDITNGSAIRKWFWDNLAYDSRTAIVAYHDIELHQVIWYFQSSAGFNNDTGIGYDYIEQAWTIYNYGRSAAMEQNVFANPMSGDYAGNVYNNNVGTDANGAALPVQLTTFELDLGSQDTPKMLQMLRIGLAENSGSYPLQVTVNMSQQLGGLQTSYGPYYVPLQGAPLFLRASGRFMQLSFSSNDVGAAFRLNSISAYGVPMGQRP